MQEKRLYINTMGCQMNVYDSRQIFNRLSTVGYTETADPAMADLIIVNTCSIRAKAEQKAFSFLGRLTPLKEFNPQLIIAIGGCVAQQQGRAIMKRMPHVDIVFGTQAIARLPRLIQRVEATRRRILDIELTEAIDSGDYILDVPPSNDVAAFVTIMRGCDNYCTYCVVPYVRGREASRAQEDILIEIRNLVSKGVREVTLLGQNVNSYGQKEGHEGFPRLLSRINEVAGLERIRFTTSHPKDLSPELIAAFIRLDKLCRHIHLPVQSGSNAVLHRMNRRYTRQDYLTLITRLRQTCPDIAITSDIIVGFPGETDADFKETIDLIRQVEYDNLFAFIYSDRPDAPAVRFGDKISEALKKERLQAVLESQKTFSRQKNLTLIGSVQRILVDGLSKNQPADTDSGIPSIEAGGGSWSGRTTTNKIVHFTQPYLPPLSNQTLTGRLMDIMIESVMPHCLWGRPVQPAVEARLLGKGA